MFQDTIADHQDNTHIPRACAGTVQQSRRHNNTSGVHWPNSESCESFYSDQKYEQGSSTNSLDTGVVLVAFLISQLTTTHFSVEPQFAITDKVYDKVTGALGAIRLPTGKYWPDDQLDGGRSSFLCND